MTWFYATSVSVTNGATVVSVHAGDDIAIIQPGDGLVIGTQPPVEVKRTYLDGSSNKKIELLKPWPYGSQSNQSAEAYPTAGDFQAATEVLKQLIESFALATQAEAQAGTENTKPMTALRVKQAMDALLGSASKLDASDGALDTTFGRAFKTGDFGAGNTAVAAPFGDLNQATGSGFYRQETPTNGINYSGTLHMQSGDGRQQLTIDRQGGRAAFRGSPNVTLGTDAAFGPWRELYHTGNALGVVRSPIWDPAYGASAIVEQGSNSNGDYTKFIDGRMICTFSYNEAAAINSATGALFSSANITWNYPAAFAAGLAPTVGGIYAPARAWVGVAGIGSTQVVFSWMAATSFAAAGYAVQLLAVGRWR